MVSSAPVSLTAAWRFARGIGSARCSTTPPCRRRPSWTSTKATTVTVWLATAGGGIVRVRGTDIAQWELGKTAADDMVYSLDEDFEGNLWIGTAPGGLHRLSDGVFTTWTAEDGLPDNVVESIYEDRHGAMWIGTHAGGLCRIGGGWAPLHVHSAGVGGQPRQRRAGRCRRPPLAGNARRAERPPSRHGRAVRSAMVLPSRSRQRAGLATTRAVSGSAPGAEASPGFVSWFAPRVFESVDGLAGGAFVTSLARRQGR